MNIVTVDFYQDTLFAVQQPDGAFVAVKPINDSMGMRWSGQYERIMRDPILSEGVRVIRIPSPGGVQEMLCLRLDLLHGWLFTIDESRVKDEKTRQKVLTYKRECYGALYRHFQGQARQGPAEASEDGRTAQPDNLKLRKIEVAIRIFGERAGAELWFLYGMDITPGMKPAQDDLFAYAARRRPASSSLPLIEGEVA